MEISAKFSELGIVITRDTLQRLKVLVHRFETRREHGRALNTPLLGVTPISFQPEDADAFYALFNIRKERQITDLLREVTAVDMSRKVSSNPFNHLAIWVIHLSKSLLKNTRDQDEFAFYVAKYLHYRFFTSIVGQHLPHGANENVMQYTIDHLSSKFSSVQKGTWRNVIEARAADLTGKNSIHRGTLERGGPDLDMIYVITDAQSRMRDLIKNVTGPYYENYERRNAIDTFSSVGEIDGEKIIISKTSSHEAMISGAVSEIMNVRELIEPDIINSLCNSFKVVTPKAFQALLQSVSSLAVTQRKKQLTDKDTYVEDGVTYVGVTSLVRDIVQSAYRYCVTNNFPLNDRVLVYSKVKSAYSASRTNDKYIISVKNRAGILVDALTTSTHSATKASLRIAFIMYIVYKALKHAPTR
jgi:hypothetical protein